MKKFTLISLVVLFVVFFAGCGKTNLSLNTKINRNGSIDIVSKTETTDILPDLLNQNTQINSSLLNIENKNSKIKFYKEDGKNISEFDYHFKNYTELNSAFSNVNQKAVKFEVVKHKGFLHNTYDYSVDIQSSLTPESINERITSEIANKGIPLDSAKVKSINDFLLNSVNLSNSLTIPGKITKSNGEITGSTVTWSYPLGQIKENTKMNASFRVINPVGLVTLLIIIFVVILTFVILYFLHKKKAKIKS